MSRSTVEDDQSVVSPGSQAHPSKIGKETENELMDTEASHRNKTSHSDNATDLQAPSSNVPSNQDRQPNTFQQLQNLLKLPQFEYPPLPAGNHIRLLELLPREDGLFSRCRLVYKELAPDLKYQAISYCWDDPSVQKLPDVFGGQFPIECNNSCLMINGGLVQVLKQLPESLSSGFLWADGICINQRDLAERAQQVSMMHRIYANAVRVLVYLGLDKNENAPAAVELIYRTVSAAHEYHAQHGEFPTEPKPETMRTDIFERYGDRGWAPVHELFSLKWFSRVWVQQEIGLAKDAVLLWGSSGMSFRYVVEFACIHQANASSDKNKDSIRLGQDLFHQFLDIWCQYEAPGSAESKLPCTKVFQRLEHAKSEEATVSSGRILRLLQAARKLQCTDPRDRVFAFLGHPAARVPDLGDDGVLIRPDYEASKDEIYLSVAKTILAEMGSLMLLSCVMHKKDPADAWLPSWVPRWDEETSLPAFGLLLPGRDLYYDASKSKSRKDQENTKESVPFQIDLTNVLKATGLKFDLVTHTCGPFGSDDFSHAKTSFSTGDRSTSPFVGTIDQILRMIISHPSYPSDTPYPSVNLAVASTLVLGLFLGGVPAESRPDHLLQSFYAYYFQGKEVQSGPEVPSIVPEHGHHYAWGLGLSGRKFFITSSGYFGAGPAVMHEGDTCCVLFGSRVPFVLRDTEGKNESYRFLGECFVQGIMRGEVMDRWEQKGLKEETFHIV